MPARTVSNGQNVKKGSTAPTREQIGEAIGFLESVLEDGIAQNDWEQNCVQRLLDGLRKR